MRAAVVGCGAIGAAATRPALGVWTHAAAYAAHAETELVAVADPDLPRAREAAARWGAPAAFAGAAELLEAAAPEIVSVCTPDATHAELVGLALEAPATRAVLAEKPLALDPGAAGALAAAARERGVVLAVNYTRRFAPALRALAGEVRGGALGELQHVGGAYVKGLRHNGTHWLDLLRMLAGDPVAASGTNRLREPGPDPTLDAELVLPGGARARLAGLDTRAFTHFEMDLIGTEGRIRIAESGHVAEAWRVGEDPRHPGYRVLLPAGPPQSDVLRDSALHAVADVVRAVRSGGEPACTGEDGVAALRLAEAIAASAARHTGAA